MTYPAQTAINCRVKTPLPWSFKALFPDLFTGAGTFQGALVLAPPRALYRPSPAKRTGSPTKAGVRVAGHGPNKYWKEVQEEQDRIRRSRTSRGSAPEPPPLQCWCGARDDLMAFQSRWRRNTWIFCKNHEPVFCNCWEIATRVEGGKAVCEDCWERKNR